MTVRHFITLTDITTEEFRKLIRRGIELKQAARRDYEPLKNRVLGMIFEKSSTRTRISFETGMVHFGGSAIFLPPRDTQLGRGEPIVDSARVISSMVDCVMMRTHNHATIVEFANYSKVPVINGLCDRFHPCQLLADMQTYHEHRGEISGKNVAWIGDGNNMCHSYINAARLLNFNLRIASPKGYQPDANLVTEAQANVVLCEDAETAADQADLVVTDVWASMGQEDEQKKRITAFQGYQVNDRLMTRASPECVFMHCLPAHRGEEVTASVIDGPQSIVWDEAENRLHAQKALLEFLLS